MVIWLADFCRFCCAVVLQHSNHTCNLYTAYTYDDKSVLFRTGKLKFYGVAYILY